MEASGRRGAPRYRWLMLALALCLALIPAVAAASPQSAPSFAPQQVGGAWNDGFQVQNLDPDHDANIIIAYYRPDGTRASADQVDTIPANRSKTYYRATMSVPEGFNGSVTVSADTNVAVIANQTSADPALAGSYRALDDGATRLYLPLLMRGNGGWDSKIYVQNLSTASSEVSIEFFQGSTLMLSQRVSLVAHASLHLDQGEMGALPAPWVGSAVLSATKPIAAVVDQANGSALMSYSALGGGATRLYAPLIMTDNAGWFTGLQVQNVGDTETTVTLKVDGTAVATETVAAGNAVTWYPIPGTAAGFVGSATVESSGAPIVGIVNEWKPAAGQGMSYATFGQGSSALSAPLVMLSNSGWSSGLQVQNIGTEATDVNLMIDGVSVATASIDPGRSATWYPLPGMAAGQVGAARVTSSKAPIVAIVNEVRYGSPGENAMAYEAFNE